MHTLTITGTSGPIYRVVTLLIANWQADAGYDGLPGMLQLLGTRRGLLVTTSSYALARYLYDRLADGIDPVTASVDHNRSLWRGSAPSSMTVELS